MANSSANKLATSQRKKWQQKLQQTAAKKNYGAKTSISVVLDTNIWYSAIVFGETPERCLDYCLKCTEIIISEMLIVEIIDRLKRKTQAPYRWLRMLKSTLDKICSVVSTDHAPLIVRDPKDNHVIAAALEGHCDYIITGDKDLLVLAEYQGITIVTPAEFMSIV